MTDRLYLPVIWVFCHPARETAPFPIDVSRYAIFIVQMTSILFGKLNSCLLPRPAFVLCGRRSWEEEEVFLQ